MRRFRLHCPASLLAVLLLVPVAAPAQQRSAFLKTAPSRQAEGSLTVICTVVSSAGLVIGPDGQQHLIVANAVGRADSESLIHDGSRKNDRQKSSGRAARQEQSGKAGQVNGDARVP